MHNKNLDAPIHFTGSPVGDLGYDKGLNRFIQLESLMTKAMDSSNYDDDVFKRRNLSHIKNKELMKHADNYPTKEDSIKNNRPISKSQVKLKPNYQISNPKVSEFRLRERGYSNQHSNGKERYAQQNDRLKLISRDERLKVPKSSHFQNVRQLLKEKVVNKSENSDPKKAAAVAAKSSKKLNNTVDDPYNAVLNDMRLVEKSDKKPQAAVVNQLFEGVGSRRKRLLQISNQTCFENPFLKSRMPSNAKYISQHLGMPTK